MWLSKFFSSKKKSTPVVSNTVGVEDIKKRLEQIVEDVVWSGDVAFSSRDQVLVYIGGILDSMRDKWIEIDTTVIDATEAIASSEDPPKVCTRTKLKPLASTKTQDTVPNE